MDALYFQTESKEQFLTALALHEDPTKDDGKFFNGIYQGPDFIAFWIGKIPVSGQAEHGSEITYQPGYFFNIWVHGQPAMDRFSTLSGCESLPWPITPNFKLF